MHPSRSITGVAVLTAAMIAVVLPVRAEGAWVQAADLTFARALHTATTLTDGRVLVFGGRGCPGVAASASFGTELYDPRDGSWAPLPVPLVPRDRHAAVRLADGRVLVAGGQSTQGACPARLHTPVTLAEIFDPKGGEWSSGGVMRTNRVNLSLSLLPDGHVLAFGGTGAELFDPTTSTWRWTLAPEASRTGHTATPLRDGRVLVAGGSAPGVGDLSIVEAFDAATETWTTLAPLSAPRAAHQATLLADGRVLVAGGIDGDLITASAEMYDPVANAWSAAAPLTTPRAFHTMTALADGRVLVAGGSEGLGGTPLASAEIYDPTTGRWTPSTMPSWHTSHAAAALADGSVLVVGGGYEAFGFTAAADRFIP